MITLAPPHHLCRTGIRDHHLLHPQLIIDILKFSKFEFKRYLKLPVLVPHLEVAEFHIQPLPYLCSPFNLRSIFADPQN